MNNTGKIYGLMCLLLATTPVAFALDLPGIIKYETVVELSIPVSGVVSRVLAEEGQVVKQEQVLLELDEVPFKAGLDKAAAELRLLKAERDEAEKEHQRNNELFERLVLSVVSLDNSKLKLTRADSLWEAKKAEFEQVKYEFEKSRLRAPFPGVIIERFVEPGQTIRTLMQAPVLFRLAETSSFIIESEVDGDKIRGLAHGAALDARLSGKTYRALVKSVLLLSPARSLSQPARYRIRAKLENVDDKLRPGLPATLVVPGPRE